MGCWGDEPWESDGGADWFGDLMDKSSLREYWREGIAAEDDEGEVVFAAAWLFVQLGRVYIWPIRDFDADLQATLRALHRLREDERMAEGQPVEWERRIDGYIAELESRLPASGSG
ncbi:MAG: hypothetical protein LBC97_16220 [Bifidobacteriaceae bacterium]|jgi:hypothetical protein|nr:hypothetical protein [Bifidobacteriaceae bacterium]